MKLLRLGGCAVGSYTGFIQEELASKLFDIAKKLNANDYIVSFNNGVKATSRQIQSRLKPILDRLFNKGLEKDDAKNRTVIHTLRHTFASHLAINEVAPPGGCKVRVNCIINIDVETAIAVAKNRFEEKSLYEITPTIADNKCPPIKFLG